MRVAQIMWEGDLGCVVVVDADGKAVAMITDRDISTKPGDPLASCR